MKKTTWRILFKNQSTPIKSRSHLKGGVFGAQTWRRATLIILKANVPLPLNTTIYHWMFEKVAIVLPNVGTKKWRTTSQRSSTSSSSRRDGALRFVFFFGSTSNDGLGGLRWKTFFPRIILFIRIFRSRCFCVVFFAERLLWVWEIIFFGEFRRCKPKLSYLRTCYLYSVIIFDETESFIKFRWKIINFRDRKKQRFVERPTLDRYIFFVNRQNVQFRKVPFSSRGFVWEIFFYIFKIIKTTIYKRWASKRVTK